MQLRPNPGCDDNFCKQRQSEVKARPPKETEAVGDSSAAEEVTHEDNEWGLYYVVVSSSQLNYKDYIICLNFWGVLSKILVFIFNPTVD